jgi:hypothetical protein
VDSQQSLEELGVGGQGADHAAAQPRPALDGEQQPDEGFGQAAQAPVGAGVGGERLPAGNGSPGRGLLGLRH